MRRIVSGVMLAVPLVLMGSPALAGQAAAPSGYSRLADLVVNPTKVITPGTNVEVTGRLLGGSDPGHLNTPIANEYVGEFAQGNNHGNPGGYAMVMTDAQGRFTLYFPMWGDSDWKLEYQGDSTYQPTSAFPPVTALNSTSLSSIKVGPGRVKRGKPITISGVLRFGNQWCANGDAAMCAPQTMRGQRITLAFQAAGSKKWTTAATTTTANNGAFRFQITDRKTGRWRVGYAGNSQNSSALSSPYYVKVA